MKKVLLIIMALVAVVQAGMFSTISSALDKEIDPTAKYQLDVYGYNPRIYEWDTENGMKCIMVFSSDNKKSEPTIFCIKK